MFSVSFHSLHSTQPHPPSSCLQFPTVLLFTTGQPKQYVRMSRAVNGQEENKDVVEQIRFSRRWGRRRVGGRRCWGDQGYAKDWGSGFVVGRNVVSVLLSRRAAALLIWEALWPMPPLCRMLWCLCLMQSEECLGAELDICVYKLVWVSFSFN